VVPSSTATARALGGRGGPRRPVLRATAAPGATAADSKSWWGLRGDFSAEEARAHAAGVSFWLRDVGVRAELLGSNGECEALGEQCQLNRTRCASGGPVVASVKSSVCVIGVGQDAGR